MYFNTAFQREFSWNACCCFSSTSGGCHSLPELSVPQSGTPREPEQLLALAPPQHGCTSAPGLCRFYFWCLLWPSMTCVPFLEGYIAAEFQLAFHWVSRSLNFVVTHTKPSNTTQFIFIFITHRGQSQPQQLGCTALYTTPPTLEPLECTTARSQQFSLPTTSGVLDWMRLLAEAVYGNALSVFFFHCSFPCASIGLRRAFGDFQPLLSQTLRNQASL